MVHRATHQAIWCTGTLYYYTFPVSGAHRMPQGPCPVAANSPRRPGPHADERGGYRAAEYMRAQPLLHTVGYSLITYGYSPITYGYSPRTPGTPPMSGMASGDVGRMHAYRDRVG